jgi:hypothetical protein
LSYRAALCAPLLAIATLASAGPLNNLQNGSFDTDITGWELSFGDAVAAISWDGTTGFAQPGSLRLDLSTFGLFGKRVHSECLSAPAGSAWRVRGAARAASGTSCSISLWALEDCLSVAAGVSAGECCATESWTQLDGEALVLSPPNLNLRVRLGGGGPEVFGTGTCHFDDIQLLGPSLTVLPIPTLHPAAMVGLIATLALFGCWLLWRRDATT